MDSIPGPPGRVTVRSPEGVGLEFEIAGPALRMAAYALDLVLVVLVAAAVFITAILVLPLFPVIQAQLAAIGAQLSDARDAVLVPVFVLVYVLMSFSELLYFGLWETLSGGRTPGKYLMRLRVVGIDGQPLEPKAALLRNALRVVDALPASYLCGLVAMVASRTGQRLGDHAAGTWVIRTDRNERPEEIAFTPGLEPLPLSRAQLAKLGSREIVLLRATLRRLPHIPAQQQRDLISPVLSALCQRLAIDIASVHEPAVFLEQLLLASHVSHGLRSRR
jgi:uncharacterized RDD family membrane protein YckC